MRKAIVLAGYSPTLADHAELAWRLIGFCPGLGLAIPYAWPDHLKGKPRYHVRIHRKDSAGSPVNVPGLLLLGVGL